MAHWLVTVSAEIPYPWSRAFGIDRSSAGAAASDGVKLYRKAVREKVGKAKKLDTISIKVARSAGTGCGCAGECLPDQCCGKHK